jgi:hypothetical protein
MSKVQKARVLPLAARDPQCLVVPQILARRVEHTPKMAVPPMAVSPTKALASVPVLKEIRLMVCPSRKGRPPSST